MSLLGIGALVTTLLFLVGYAYLSVQWADTEDYQQAGLIHHNYLRARHGSPPLILDPDLNEMGRKCAHYYATNNLYDHSCPFHMKYYPKKSKEIGECLWHTGDNKWNYHDAAVGAVRRFYQEIEEYNFNDVESNIPKFLLVGHLAQMLWKGTRYLGVGVYYSKSNPEFGVMIVYHYYPLYGFGDVEKMKENILPPTKDAASIEIYGRWGWRAPNDTTGLALAEENKYLLTQRKDSDS